MARSKVTNLIEEFRGLNEVEQAVFLDQVDPQPEPEAPAKKTRKPRAARTPKLTGLPKPGSDAPKADANNGALCVAMVPTLDVPCGEPEDALIHDPKGGYASYHPFQSSAPVATRRSRLKKEGTSPIPNTEGETASAMSASSGGD